MKRAWRARPFSSSTSRLGGAGGGGSAIGVPASAKDDSRSLSSLLEKVLIDYLRENGYLTAKRRDHTVPPSTRGG